MPGNYTFGYTIVDDYVGIIYTDTLTVGAYADITDGTYMGVGGIGGVYTFIGQRC